MRLPLRSVGWLLLPVGLAPGCFQPLDPYEPPDYGEPAASSPGGQDSAVSQPGTSPAPSTPQPLPGAPALPIDAGTGSVAPPPPSTWPPLPTPGVPITPPPLDAGALDMCSSLPPGRCGVTPGCFATRFYLIDYERNCSTSETRPSCARFPCGLLGNTLARDPKGQVFWVPVGCVPGDFTQLSPPSTPQQPACPTAAAIAACARHRDEASCGGDLDYQCMIVTAQAYDPVKQCIGDPAALPRFVRCMAWQNARPGPVRYFRDAQGRVWQVPPEGLDAIPNDWLPIAPSSVLPDAGAELPVCFNPLI